MGLKAWPAQVVMGLIRGYQLLISPLRPQTCRYYPSCSAYAVTALKRHGLIRGAALSLWRLLRCNPWSDGGVDYVPSVWPAAPRNGREVIRELV